MGTTDEGESSEEVTPDAMRVYDDIVRSIRESARCETIRKRVSNKTEKRAIAPENMRVIVTVSATCGSDAMIP